MKNKIRFIFYWKIKLFIMSQSTPLSLETMKNKILHYHQANQSPAALRVLLDNLKQSYIT